jgi:hypothetical protein
MYYLNLVISYDNNKYKLELIQKSFINDLDLNDYIFFDCLKSSNKFSINQIKSINKDILTILKDIYIKSNFIKYENNIVKLVNYIIFDCYDEYFNIICSNLINLFDKLQVFHEYIEIPNELESDNEEFSEENDECDENY